MVEFNWRREEMLDCGKQRIHYLIEIQKKREEMYFFGKKYGLSATETINSSQDLDKLLNEYYHRFQNHIDAEPTKLPRKMSWFIYQEQKQVYSL